MSLYNHDIREMREILDRLGVGLLSDTTNGLFPRVTASTLNQVELLSPRDRQGGFTRWINYNPLGEVNSYDGVKLLRLLRTIKTASLDINSSDCIWKLIQGAKTPCQRP